MEGFRRPLRIFSFWNGSPPPASRFGLLLLEGERVARRLEDREEVEEEEDDEEEESGLEISLVFLRIARKPIARNDTKPNAAAPITTTGLLKMETLTAAATTVGLGVSSDVCIGVGSLVSC